MVVCCLIISLVLAISIASVCPDSSPKVDEQEQLKRQRRYWSMVTSVVVGMVALSLAISIYYTGSRCSDVRVGSMAPKRELDLDPDDEDFDDDSSNDGSKRRRVEASSSSSSLGVTPDSLPSPSISTSSTSSIQPSLQSSENVNIDNVKWFKANNTRVGREALRKYTNALNKTMRLWFVPNTGFFIDFPIRFSDSSIPTFFDPTLPVNDDLMVKSVIQMAMAMGLHHDTPLDALDVIVDKIRANLPSIEWQRANLERMSRITPEETRMVYKYVKTGYETINFVLRGIRETTDYSDVELRMIDGVIDKMNPLEQDIVVWRYETFGFLNTGTYQKKGYLSTTIDPLLMNRVLCSPFQKTKRYILRIVVPRGAKCIYVPSFEQELIFPHNTSLTVTSIDLEGTIVCDQRSVLGKLFVMMGPIVHMRMNLPVNNI